MTVYKDWDLAGVEALAQFFEGIQLPQTIVMQYDKLNPQSRTYTIHDVAQFVNRHIAICRQNVDEKGKGVRIFYPYYERLENLKEQFEKQCLSGSGDFGRALKIN